MKKSAQGKVIRIPANTVKQLNKLRTVGDSWNDVITELLNKQRSHSMWALPSMLFTRKHEAVKHSIELAAETELEFEDREFPIKVILDI